MRKRDELADPNSCFNKAGDNAMLFVLLDSDESSVDGVRAWIESRIRKGKNKRSDLKIRSAEEWIEIVSNKLAAKSEREKSRNGD